jgi:hypothetical protein
MLILQSRISCAAVEPRRTLQSPAAQNKCYHQHTSALVWDLTTFVKFAVAHKVVATYRKASDRKSHITGHCCRWWFLCCDAVWSRGLVVLSVATQKTTRRHNPEECHVSQPFSPETPLRFATHYAHKLPAGMILNRDTLWLMGQHNDKAATKKFLVYQILGLWKWWIRSTFANDSLHVIYIIYSRTCISIHMSRRPSLRYINWVSASDSMQVSPTPAFAKV